MPPMRPPDPDREISTRAVRAYVAIIVIGGLVSLLAVPFFPPHVLPFPGGPQ